MPKHLIEGACVTKKGLSDNCTSGVTLVFLICLSIVGCGGGSSDSSPTDATLRVELPLDNNLKNIQLEAGIPIEIRFTYDIPGSITGQGDFRVDLAGTLQNASLSTTPASRKVSLGQTLTMLAKALVKDALAADTAQVTVHISFAGDPNVCSSSTMFGPYDITGAIGMALTSSTESVTPTQRSIDIMNNGSLEVCIATTPPIDAYATVSAIMGEVEPCAEGTVEIAGSSWTGTYQCDNFGVPSDPPGSPVSISITQNTDGSYQYIDNEGAVYNGHLCGNKLRFNGGLSGSYTESGTLVFSSNNTATKTSTWNGIVVGTEGGDCSDELTRN